MKTTTAKRTCEACGDRKAARWPKDNPHFCTQRCAAEHAFHESSYQWCGKHGDWYHEDDGCYECGDSNSE